MKISFTAPDSTRPRTVFYERFADAVRRRPGFVAEGQADLLFPAEDTALETNWPRYGNQTSAFVRGRPENAYSDAYLQRLADTGRPVCVLNMNPFVRLPLVFAKHRKIIVADGSLPASERPLNPRTISLPALPIITGTAAEKTVLASFRGVASHPCREALRQLHDGANIIVELVPRENHAGRLDAVTGSGDAAYAGLLARSLFAFVPRGDALFSYRLLEALSFGCIPIVISDGWVLPFDRLIPWKDAALVVAENAVAEIPEMLGRIPKAQAEEMRANARGIYESRLANLDLILESLLMEAGMLLGAGS